MQEPAYFYPVILNLFTFLTQYNGMFGQVQASFIVKVRMQIPNENAEVEQVVCCLPRKGMS